ncbi:MAG: FG-GAP-like repeat-containing protein, partial [Bacteroidales bacterium]|nr:FG-GAP-like repeat-containing protein [Bacteroidales bacterium]
MKKIIISFLIANVCCITLQSQNTCNLTYVSPYNSSNPYEHNTSLPVGAISGASGVSPSGAATYEIPIFASPGIGGVEPKISIVYNSQSGNGILGQGWQLSGLSSISLSPNLTYNDGYFEAIKLNSSGTGLDRYVKKYSLDGNRLVIDPDNSNYYRTEVETFQQIEHQTSGTDRFIVETKDGMKCYYGQTTNSQIKLSSNSNNKILSWLIDSVEDVNSNYLVYEYFDIGGEKLLQRIKYTGNTENGLLPFNSIEFYYGERADKSRSFISGTQFNQTMLLGKIEIRSDNQVVKVYELKYFKEIEYENEDITGLPIVHATKLAEVVEKNGNGTALNPTVIEWGEKGESEISGLSMDYYWTYIDPAIVAMEDATIYNWYHEGGEGEPTAIYQSGDFNGDGLMDFCFVFNFYLYRNIFGVHSYFKYYSYLGTYINNGDGTFQFYSYNITNSSNEGDYWYVCVGDYNYDGKDDIIRVNQRTGASYKQYWNDGSHLWDNYTTPFSYYDVASSTVNNNDDNRTRRIYYAGNITGDGKKQEIFFKKEKVVDNGNNPTILHENIRVKSEPIDTTIMSDVTQFAVNWHDTDKSDFAPVPCDFDGDGVIDFIDIFDLKFAVYEYNNQTNSLQIIYEIPSGILSFDNMTKFITGDFNGDGKTDLLVQDLNISYVWWVYFSDGKMFHISGSLGTYNGKEISICDINGDGKDDVILQPSDNNLFVYYSKGNGSFYSKYIPVSYNSNYADNYHFGFGDFNNDGINDIIYGATEISIIYNYKDDKSKLVKSITDGLTVKTEFEYSPLNEISEKADIHEDTYPLFGSLPVVSKIIQPTGLTDSNVTTETTYDYQRGRIHVGGKGFIGFEEINSVNLIANIKTKTINDINFDYNLIYHSILQTSSIDATDTDISEQKNENIIRKMSDTNLNYIAVMPKYSGLKNFLLHESNFTKSTIFYENEYSGQFLGNIENVITNYSDIYYEITKYSHYVNNGSWCISKPERITKTTNRDGSETGSEIRLTYNNLGQVEESKSDSYPSAGGKALAASYSYDNYGNVLTERYSGIFDADNNFHDRTTDYQYDDRGQFVKKITNSTGLITEYLYEPKFGNKTYEKDFLGNETTYQYNDGFGNLTKIISPITTGIITRNWEATDFAANFAFNESIEPTGGKISVKIYDILGRTVFTKNSLYDQLVFKNIAYNSDGTVEKESLQHFGATVSNWKTYTYDGYKRPIEISALGLTTTVSYSVGSTTTTTPDGNHETKTVNAAGEITEISSNNGIVEYKYNAFGKPQKITAAGTITSMDYDEYGNQIKLIDANAGTTEYRYNAFGELIQQGDANHNKFTITYDNAGRIIQKKCINNPDFTIEYIYYTSGNSTGLLEKEVMGNGYSKQYIYNNLGNVTQTDETIDAATYSHKYSYDQYGRVATYQYPSGYKIKNEYDQHGFLTAVYEETSNTRLWELTGNDFVNEMGQIKEYYSGPNNLKTKNHFNSNYELEQITTNNQTVAIFDYSFTFEHSTGNLLNRKDNTRNMTETFTYDNIQRLHTWQNDYDNILRHTAYFGNGNIENKYEVGAYQYDSKPHAVIQIYDHPGTSTTVADIEEQLISYNPFQKADTITEGDYQYIISYGTDAQRKKTELFYSNTLQCTKIYSGLYEKITTDTITRELHYIPTGSGILAVHVVTNGSGGVNYFLLKDYLGSVMKIVDATGNTIEEHSYDPWGNHRNPDTWEQSYFVSYFRGYTGHEMLPQFQLINMNGRMYDPVIGRVLSPDNYVQDATNAQSYNRYSYCLNNPLKYTDPSGNFAFTALAIGAMIGAFANVVI